MKIKFKQFVAMHSIATQIRRICAIAIVAIIAFTFTACENSNDTTHTHQWGAWKSNGTQHWKECSCGEEYGRTNHNGNPCPVCEYNDSSHSHSYSDTWLKDATHHWKECSCGDKKQVASHSGNPCICGYNSDTDPICECNSPCIIPNCQCPDCPGSGSRDGLTITDIPAKYNGKYVLIQGTGSSDGAPDILTWWSAGKFLENTDELIITNGRITLPMWTATFNQGYTYEKYTGDHDYRLTIIIISTEPTIEVVQNFTDYLLASISFSTPRVTFLNGNAAKSVNDGRFTHYNDSGFGFVLINNNTEYEIDRGITTAVEIIIPSTYEGKPVTAIAGGGFMSYTRMTSITIPNSITKISVQAFWGCSGLTAITIPNTVTSIENMAFSSCNNLVSVNFQAVISTENFGSISTFPGDLRDKYLAGGIGTYTRTAGSDSWTKI